MAVTNNATLLEDFEGAGPSFSSIGGGSGAALNDDIIIAGTQSAGRRADNKTNFGFFANPGATTNLSGGGWWIKTMVWVTQYLSVTAMNLRNGSATTAYESHAITVSEYPPLGGWWPIWVEVDAGTNTGSPNFSISDEFGIDVNIGDVGGNASNLILDQIHASQRPVMTWDGSTGSFVDFATTNDANALGTLRQQNGVYNLYSNLQIGSATATTFTSVGAVVLAPDYTHLGSGSTWLGVDIDLQNASTVVTWTDGVYGSADPQNANNKPDLLVTGTSGTADLSGNRFQGLRAAEFTSGVTCGGATFAECGALTMLSAGTVTSCVFTSSTSASSIIWNIAADPDTYLSDLAFTSDGSNHALELGLTSPTTVTLNGFTYSGYAGSNGSTGNECVWVRRTSGTVTININGGATPSIRTDGATVVVVNSVTVSVAVIDADDLSAVASARVLVEATTGAGTNNLPVEETVTITRSGSTATVAHTAHGVPDGEQVVIRYAAQPEYNGVQTITVTGVNSYTYTVSGTPTTPATIAAGKSAITSTGVILSGLTDGSGILSRSFPYSGTQDVIGKAAKSTSTPYRKRGIISGQIGTGGLATTSVMSGDG